MTKESVYSTIAGMISAVTFTGIVEMGLDLLTAFLVGIMGALGGLIFKLYISPIVLKLWKKSGKED